MNHNINDFTQKEKKTDIYIDDVLKKCVNESNNDYMVYEAKKNNIVLNQKLGEDDPLKIWIHKNIKLQDYIEKINKYLHWMSGECKNELIKCFNDDNENYKDDYGLSEESGDEEWYEGVSVFSAEIIITKEGKLLALITGTDDFTAQDEPLIIVMEEYKVISAGFVF